MARMSPGRPARRLSPSELRAAIETLEIASDQKLFQQILGSAPNLDENLRLRKLHSFEEAFENCGRGIRRKGR